MTAAPKLQWLRISMPSARFRRSATSPKRCMPGRSARSATVRREESMQIEVVPTWPIGENDVLVLVMAGGRELQRHLGRSRPADLALQRAQASLSHRGLGRVRRDLGGRLQGEALEGRRRGHRPLQSGRRRRRGMQRRRSDVFDLAAHLGLRDAGRLVRAILPRAVAPVDAEAVASHLGRGGLLHADARDRLSHAVRPSAAHAQARRQRAGLGRARAGSACSACSFAPHRARTRSA